MSLRLASERNLERARVDAMLSTRSGDHPEIARAEVHRYTASMEKSMHSGLADRYHFHFFVEMKERVDWKNAKPKLRYTLDDGTEINPNIRTNNYDQDGEGGSAPRGRNFRDSLNGGHFYLSCAKIGKVDHVTNYDPFVDFYPSVRLVDGFVAKGKITPDTWLFYRDKLTLNFHTAFETMRAKRRYQAEVEHARMMEESAEIEKRLRESDEYKEFPAHPLVESFKARFAKDEMRYPVLLILGPSHLGKTEFAKSIFRHPLLVEVGATAFVPDTMRTYRRYGEARHDAIVFDDVRNMRFLRDHQELFQCKSTVHELGRSPTGQNAYKVLLYRTPLIFTMNFSTQNLDLLHSCDFCSNPRNVYVLRYPPREFADLFNATFAYPSDEGEQWAEFDEKITAKLGSSLA